LLISGGVNNVLNEEGFTQVLQLIPNPSSQNNTDLLFYNDRNETCQLIITTAEGKNIRQESLVVKSGENRINLSLGDVKPGIYHLQLQTSSGLRNVRLIRLE
jgi:hypothetical protein